MAECSCPPCELPVERSAEIRCSTCINLGCGRECQAWMYWKDAEKVKVYKASLAVAAEAEWQSRWQEIASYGGGYNGWSITAARNQPTEVRLEVADGDIALERKDINRLLKALRKSLKVIADD